MSIADKLSMFIAYRLPSRVVYWCAIRLLAHATTGQYGNQIVPDLLAMEALKRWEKSCPALVPAAE